MIEPLTLSPIDIKKENYELGLFNKTVKKINELVDFADNLRKELDSKDDEIRSWIDIVYGLREQVKKIDQNLNFGQPEVKKNFTSDPYAEQKWVGCLCKFWTGDGLVRYGILRGVALNRKKTRYPYQALSTSFEHCEPVKPDDDIIFKGE